MFKYSFSIKKYDIYKLYIYKNFKHVKIFNIIQINLILQK